MDLLESRRLYFARIKMEIQQGKGVLHPRSELIELWPDRMGGLNLIAAHKAFSDENLHWEWEESHAFQAREGARD